MIGEDEYLERVVAGIHAATSGDADVRWNETLNGRQFDVTVRFKLGTLSYLVLIEVKNRTRKAGATDVEAFVTKARDNHANKAIFVTAAGFQSGAVTVARKHGVELFTVEFDQTKPELSGSASFVIRPMGDPPQAQAPEFTVGEPMLVSAIEDAELIYRGGKRFRMPSEASQMTYYADRTHLGDGRTLRDAMASKVPEVSRTEEVKRTAVRFWPAITVEPPDAYFFPAGKLKRIEMKIVGRMSRPLSGNVKIEPSAFRSPAVYTNVLTNEKTTHSLDQLPLNSAGVEVGRFYCSFHPLMYYYCDSKAGDLIRWKLIESFQNGHLIRNTITQKQEYAVFYIPVTDTATLKRLRSRLQDYEALASCQTAISGIRPQS